MAGSIAKGRRGLGHGEGRIDRIQGAGSPFLAAAGLHSVHELGATRIRSRTKQRRASMATEYLGERGIRERERKPKEKTGGGGKALACGSTAATRLTKGPSESRSLCASRGARAAAAGCCGRGRRWLRAAGRVQDQGRRRHEQGRGRQRRFGGWVRWRGGGDEGGSHSVAEGAEAC